MSRGKLRSGKAGESCCVEVSYVMAVLGKAGKVRLGLVCPGLARCGMAGKAGLGGARHGRLGVLRHVLQRRGELETKEVKMVYKWNSAAHIKADAQKAGAVFERLSNTVGLTAKNVLDASRPPDSVLHKEFEWDDSAAAEKYRESQAAYLIRSICVTTEQKAPPVRAFFKLEKDACYTHCASIFRDVEKTNSLFEIAKRELIAFQRKYYHLEQLQAIMAEIDKL